MTEQGNEVPIFNDAANGITQFIVPPPSIDGVEGVHTVQGATDLQESSLLDLSLGNTSAQFIQVLYSLNSKDKQCICHDRITISVNRT